MTEKRKALGRGLESLLPPRPVPLSTIPGAANVSTSSPTSADKEPALSLSKGGAPMDATASAATALLPGEGVREIPIDLLDDNPFQTRSDMDEDKMAELRDSIAALGVLEPILVRPVANGLYQVIAGERRVKAAYMAGKDTIPAVVRLVSDQQAMEITIVENLMREDLSILDQARAYLRLSREFGLTQDDIAERIGKDRTSVANYLRLLKMPDEVQLLVDKGNLSFGHAKALMQLDTSAQMTEVAHKILGKMLSVRQTETLVASMIVPRPAPPKKERMLDPNVRAAEENLKRALGVRVTINDNNGRGRIVLEYGSLEDFDRILEAMMGRSN